jgi:hypothetical protein
MLLMILPFARIFWTLMGIMVFCKQMIYQVNGKMGECELKLIIVKPKIAILIFPKEMTFQGTTTHLSSYTKKLRIP